MVKTYNIEIKSKKDGTHVLSFSVRGVDRESAIRKANVITLKYLGLAISSLYSKQYSKHKITMRVCEEDNKKLKQEQKKVDKKKPLTLTFNKVIPIEKKSKTVRHDEKFCENKKCMSYNAKVNHCCLESDFVYYRCLRNGYQHEIVEEDISEHI